MRWQGLHELQELIVQSEDVRIVTRGLDTLEMMHNTSHDSSQGMPKDHEGHPCRRSERERIGITRVIIDVAGRQCRCVVVLDSRRSPEYQSDRTIRVVKMSPIENRVENDVMKK